MPIRTLIACAVLAWRINAYSQTPTAPHYWLLLVQIGVTLIYLGVTLGGYGRCQARYR
jgi:hypothetical protein